MSMRSLVARLHRLCSRLVPRRDPPWPTGVPENEEGAVRAWLQEAPAEDIERALHGGVEADARIARLLPAERMTEAVMQALLEHARYEPRVMALLENEAFGRVPLEALCQELVSDAREFLRPRREGGRRGVKWPQRKHRATLLLLGRGGLERPGISPEVLAALVEVTLPHPRARGGGEREEGKEEGGLPLRSALAWMLTRGELPLDEGVLRCLGENFWQERGVLEQVGRRARQVETVDSVWGVMPRQARAEWAAAVSGNEVLLQDEAVRERVFRYGERPARLRAWMAGFPELSAEEYGEALIQLWRESASSAYEVLRRYPVPEGVVLSRWLVAEMLAGGKPEERLALVRVLGQVQLSEERGMEDSILEAGG